MTARDLTIQATDGLRLAATEFLPPTHQEQPRRVALVAGATGVQRRYYAAFASYLAARGFAVLTFDYRGIGGSRPANGSLRGFRATMRDWAVRDLGGALAAVASRWPELPLSMVAHSFGGQAVGLAPGRERISRMVTIAAPSGYWRNYRRPFRYRLAALWYGVVPTCCLTLGYFPARRLGMGEDLPSGVAREWARWCRSPEYLGDWEGHRRLTVPVLALTFTDDAYAPPEATDDLHHRYASARVERRYVTPGDHGVQRIGHFGFFREGRVAELWGEVAGWLDA